MPKLGYTKIGFCKCGIPFIRKRGRKRLYCKLCLINKRREWNRKNDRDRKERDAKSDNPKRNNYLRDKMEEYRKIGTIKDKQPKERHMGNVINIPRKDWDDNDWKRYHNKIKKHKQEILGGYQNYEEVE